MKRIVGVACASLLALTLFACGSDGDSAEQPSSPAAEGTSAPANVLEEIVQNAQADFSSTSQKLVDEQAKLFSEVGDTYEGYLAHVDAVQAWYDLAVSETESLGERAVSYGREYYQAVVDNVDVTDDRELEKATEEFYDAIYDDAFDEYYDAVYEDAFDEMYDAYYDGVIQDAYDVTPYDEWSDVHGDAYEAWSDAHGDVYEAWSDARGDVYDDYSDIRSAFYDNDFDVEGVFAAVQVKDPSEASQGGSDAAEGAEGPSASVDSDFKATLDEYEAFFDEYVAFMEEYNNGAPSADLVGRYSELMSQYTEYMSALNGIDSSQLSSADALYYSEVQNRINQKLLSVSS